jgi:UDP-GlcNAc3NAcA epimerase
MHILTIVGARPQFVKAAVVSHAFEKDHDIRETMVHTGQHFDANMSEVFFDELGIPEPDINLDIHGGHHGEMTGRMLQHLEPVLLEAEPDFVLVYGDTNSTLAGALAASKLHIPIAHVEAGLRSFNRRMPEEINRVLTDHMSDLLFAPSAAAVRNLATEGVSGRMVHLVGDVMYDAALRFREHAIAHSGILARCNPDGDPYVLCTLHRAENTDNVERLRNIFIVLEMLAKEIRVVVPLHPRTHAVLKRTGLNLHSSFGLAIIDPVGYLDMVCLESSAALIATDSGGVQKEAFFHKVPCVTFRDETEWTELIDAGWNRLVTPRDTGRLYAAMRDAIGTVGMDINLYGTGDAAANIVAALKKHE